MSRLLKNVAFLTTRRIIVTGFQSTRKSKCAPTLLLDKSQRNSPCPSSQIQVRYYCGRPELSHKLTMDEVEKRVLKVCSSHDKVASDKLELESHLMSDLGLDSLDHIEVIMAIEDEFGFEIDEMDAEQLMKPVDIVLYVTDKVVDFEYNTFGARVK